MFNDFRVKYKKNFFLSKIDENFDNGMSKEELKKKTKESIKKIIQYQEKLYAESKQSLLIVLQALDAGGKDGTIRKVFGPINPQGCQVTSFKAPTSLELSHDFLWRIHKEVPQKGMIKIFNRSHYEDVLIVRVHNFITDNEAKKRYEHINNFEKLLVDNNTHILKFFLYISKEEQKKRFQKRIDISEKNWKFSKSDLEERKLWCKYIKQFEEVFYYTSTDYAPWYVVPANSKTFRNYFISLIVLETMKNMNPQFPPSERGIKDIIIE